MLAVAMRLAWNWMPPRRIVSSLRCDQKLDFSITAQITAPRREGAIQAFQGGSESFNRTAPPRCLPPPRQSSTPHLSEGLLNPPRIRS